MGEEYVVAPVTSIVPGVLNGSEGPLLYPDEDVEESTHSWNMMPLVAWHPVINGETVSARRPDVLNQRWLGWVFNSTFDSHLTHEAWFNVKAVQNLDEMIENGEEKVLPRLLEGIPIEVSTGLLTDNEPAKEGAVYNGTPYKFIARNYKPDHLAVLPNEVGACSNEDGCGIGVVTNTMTVNTITVLQELEECLNCGGEGGTMGPCPGGDRGAISGKSLVDQIGDAQAEVKSTESALNDHKRKLKADGVFRDEGNVGTRSMTEEEYKEEFRLTRAAQDAASKVSKLKAAKAKEEAVALDKERKEKAASSQQPSQRSLGIKKGRVGQRRNSQGPDEEEEEEQWDQDWMNVFTQQEENPIEGDADMVPKFNKKKTIAWLTTNCECWKAKGSADVLNKMDDDQVHKLGMAAMNAGKFTLILNNLKGLKTNAKKKAVKANEGEEEMAGVNIADLAKFLGIATDAASDPVGFVKELQGTLTEILSRLGGESAPATPAPAEEEVTAAADPMATEEEEEEEPVVMKEADPKPKDNKEPEKTPTGNKKKPQTEKEWLASAPPGIRRMALNWMEHDKQERTNLLKRIVANYEPGSQKRKDMWSRYAKVEDIQELRDLADLVNPVNNSEDREVYPIFPGSGGLVENTENQQEADQEEISAMVPQALPYGKNRKQG